MYRPLLVTIVGLSLALLPSVPSPAAVGGELTELEGYVGRHPSRLEARRRLAQSYAERGFVEEAAAQYLAVLAADRSDAEAAAGLERLTQQQMPAWLPPEADDGPFTALVTHAPAAGPGESRRGTLVTAAFEAREGDRRDPVHGWLYSRILYGYVWDEARQRWMMAARAHFVTDPPLAQASLRTALVMDWLVRQRLGIAPARGAEALDIWLPEKGKPGARTVGHDIYLYAVGAARAPEEWLREVAHECGHAELPGIGGFTKTDDAWADGHLGELLFTAWLAEGQPESFPWPIAGAEALARPQRQALMAAAVRPNPKLLAGADARARDHFLGLALRVEAAAGPQFLGEVLSHCPRGSAAQFVAVAEKLARERGVKLWPTSAK